MPSAWAGELPPAHDGEVDTDRMQFDLNALPVSTQGASAATGISMKVATRWAMSTGRSVPVEGRHATCVFLLLSRRLFAAAARGTRHRQAQLRSGRWPKSMNTTLVEIWMQL